MKNQSMNYIPGLKITTHVIHNPNVKDSLFVKTIGIHLGKYKHLLQISVQEIHNDMILLVYEGFFTYPSSRLEY